MPEAATGRSTRLRVALTGVSHWHLPLYLEPVLADADLIVAGVADPDPRVADAVARGAGCRAWGDWRAMLDATAPDLVIVLGRHCDMPEVVQTLIRRGIPLIVEKPAGLAARQVAALAQQAAAADAFAAVPFVLRRSALMAAVEAHAPGEAVEYLSWKFIAGSNQRYRQAGCDWMLRRETSGGGCMLNLGIHFIDLSRVLLGGRLTVAGAMMSNARDRLDVEDHGVLLLRGERGSALIETGYLYPAPHMAFDLHFSIRTEQHYFVARDEYGMELRDARQAAEYRAVPITNVPYYPGFLRDAVARLRRGAKPEADLADLAAAMALLETGYALSPLRR